MILSEEEVCLIQNLKCMLLLANPCTILSVCLISLKFLMLEHSFVKKGPQVKKAFLKKGGKRVAIWLTQDELCLKGTFLKVSFMFATSFFKYLWKSQKKEWILLIKECMSNVCLKVKNVCHFPPYSRLKWEGLKL